MRSSKMRDNEMREHERKKYASVQQSRSLEIIQSEQNQWLKRCKALQQKKYRQQYQQFVVEGLRFVQEAAAHQAIAVLFVEEDQAALLDQLPALPDAAVHLVKHGLLAKILQTVHPQGIAAIACQRQWDWQMVADLRQVLIIDGVQDPGNLGTILRTALASDTQAVICLHGTVDVYNDKALRATMGAVFQLPIFQADDAAVLVEQLHQWGFRLVVSDIRAEESYQEVQFPKKTALVVSNEANGPQQIQKGDQLVKIPLYQQAESLNVAVAAGILLYAIRAGREEEL